MAPLLRKTLKAITWVAISIALLLLLLVTIIRLPPVQRKLTGFAVSFLTGKTNTVVRIGEIHIALPKSLAVKGMFLEDNNKDTLLSVERVKINLNLTGLFRKQIHVRSLTLEGATLRLKRTGTDSLFNYEHLLQALTDSTKAPVSEKKSAKAWSFRVDNVYISRLGFAYIDESQNIKPERIASDSMKPVLEKPDSSDSTGLLPGFSVKKIQISESSVLFKDSANRLTFRTGIHSVLIKEASLELNGGWQFTAGSIGMSDNSVDYHLRDTAGIQSDFNASHLNFQHISLEANTIFASDKKKSLTVSSFSAVDQNNFSITEFGTEFSMDQTSITARNLHAKTTKSVIEGDFMIGFSSVQALSDSISDMVMNLDIQNASILNSDILYFSRELKGQPYFTNDTLITSLSGKLTGSVNNITGNGLVIKAGRNTILETDCRIAGLPEFKSMEVNFPNLRLSTCRQDILLLAGQYIPATIDLPDSIVANISLDGRLKSFTTNARLTSTFGNATIDASIDEAENFMAKANIAGFDLGRLLKNPKMFGPVTAIASVSGKGLAKNTIRAEIKGEVSQIWLNAYNYHNLSLLGSLSGLEFSATGKLNDENIMFDFVGLGNLKPGAEHYKIRLNIGGADLKKLKISDNSLAISLLAAAEFSGGKTGMVTGDATITDMVISKEGKTYAIDSLLALSVNSVPIRDTLDGTAMLDIRYTGAASPALLPVSLRNYLNGYFQLPDGEKMDTTIVMPSFSLAIKLLSHPILSQVLLPKLSAFDAITVLAGFESEKQELKLHAFTKNVLYGTMEIKDIEIDVRSERKQLNYRISGLNVSTPQVNIENLLLEGGMAGGTLTANLSSVDENDNKKLVVRSTLTRQEDGLRIALDPDAFFLMNSRWGIAADNYLIVGKKGFYIHNLNLSKSESEVKITSAHDRFNEDLIIGITNFNLDEITRIFARDTVLVKGTANGNLLLKRVDSVYGIIADAAITNLLIRNVPVGDITLTASNPKAGRFDVEAAVTGKGNHITAGGYFLPDGGKESIRMKGIIHSLSLSAAEAFSMGQVTEASGSLSGSFLVEGDISAPDITGKLLFEEAVFKPTFLKSLLKISNQSIAIGKKGIIFDSFTLTDKDQHKAIIDGSVQMEKFRNLIFDLEIDSREFMLINTTARDNREFNGRLIIDSRIDISGPLSLPVIDAKVKINKGSNFTFAVPESRLTTDKGEGIVEFSDSTIRNPILLRAEKNEDQKSGIRGFDISSVIEIDKGATLKLLMDPASSDSLVVRGEAALSFALDRSGKMSLTGAYNLSEGSYLVSLESVIKKKFDIVPGSTIIWNGDPLDADISINATYSVRATPYDLVSGQVSGLSDVEKGGYKNRYPFLVYLKLRGEILHPQISFEIQLPPEEKGILGGVVNQKLILLNQDESALNKQVFALLVLGRFIQENPLETESGGTSSLVRSTVGKFVSAQLNQLSSSVVPGLGINFDIQSYNDFESGQAEGRTEIEVGLKKQLFNERLSIEVGGSVDVEGAKASQNTASDITGDVTVEYKLTSDGRYRLKAFRHNQYEGAIEGQLIETGAGILYLRDFNRWRDLFIRKRNKKPVPEPEKWP